MREINKSYVGFEIFKYVENISTGNWGCGAFQGDPQLKFLIQWISATLANKFINYYTFGEKKL
jgi:poly(ADP-ribose) glycohydrolase